jgi:hypothetical protein
MEPTQKAFQRQQRQLEPTPKAAVQERKETVHTQKVECGKVNLEHMSYRAEHMPKEMHLTQKVPRLPHTATIPMQKEVRQYPMEDIHTQKEMVHLRLEALPTRKELEQKQ